MNRSIGPVFLGLLVAACSSSGTDRAPAPLPAESRFEAGPFTVQPNSELVMCTYVRAPNEAEADIVSFSTEQTHGGHHLIVYTVDHAIDLPTSPCSQGGQPSWSQIAASQIAKEDISFPPGVGFHVQPHQQYVLETHYINPGSTPLTVSSSFRQRYAKPGEVTTRAATYFFGTMNIDIAPHTSFSKTVTCTPPVPVGARTMFAHEHRRGTGLAVDLLAGGPSAAPQRVYETKEWDSPPIKSFEQGLSIGQGDALRVSCDWTNESDGVLRYPHEMCFAVGYYWPAEAGLFCASGGQKDSCLCRLVGKDSVGAGGAHVEVTVTRDDVVKDAKGDLGSGAPIYCALFAADDWAILGPRAGASPKYIRDAIDVPLKSSADSAKLTFDDVTPGDYAVTCLMDTIGGGMFPGKGDVANLTAPKFTVGAGETAKVQTKLDFAVP